MSVTSNLCSWIQKFALLRYMLSYSKYLLYISFPLLKHEPSRIVDLNFSRKANQTKSSAAPKKIEPPSVAEQLGFISALEKLAPKAVVIPSFVTRPRSLSKHPELPSWPPTIGTK